MGPIAEWCICGEFTITHFVVSRFVHIEVNWSIPCWDMIAHTIAPGSFLRYAATTPEVNLGFGLFQ